MTTTSAVYVQPQTLLSNFLCEVDNLIKEGETKAVKLIARITQVAVIAIGVLAAIIGTQILLSGLTAYSITSLAIHTLSAAGYLSICFEIYHVTRSCLFVIEGADEEERLIEKGSFVRKLNEGFDALFNPPTWKDKVKEELDHTYIVKFIGNLKA